jgi:hypothetical protein
VHKVKDYDGGDREHGCDDGSHYVDDLIDLFVFEAGVLALKTIAGVAGREGAILFLCGAGS